VKTRRLLLSLLWVLSLPAKAWDEERILVQAQRLEALYRRSKELGDEFDLKSRFHEEMKDQQAPLLKQLEKESGLLRVANRQIEEIRRQARRYGIEDAVDDVVTQADLDERDRHASKVEEARSRLRESGYLKIEDEVKRSGLLLRSLESRLSELEQGFQSAGLKEISTLALQSSRKMESQLDLAAIRSRIPRQRPSIDSCLSAKDHSLTSQFPSTHAQVGGSCYASAAAGIVEAALYRNYLQPKITDSLLSALEAPPTSPLPLEVDERGLLHSFLELVTKSDSAVCPAPLKSKLQTRKQLWDASHKAGTAPIYQHGGDPAEILEAVRLNLVDLFRKGSIPKERYDALEGRIRCVKDANGDGSLCIEMNALVSDHLWELRRIVQKAQASRKENLILTNLAEINGLLANFMIVEPISLLESLLQGEARAKLLMGHWKIQENEGGGFTISPKDSSAEVKSRALKACNEASKNIQAQLQDSLCRNIPLAISLAIPGMEFNDGSGWATRRIFQDSLDAGHALVLTGFETDSGGQRWWLFRNSWAAGNSRARLRFEESCRIFGAVAYIGPEDPHPDYKKPDRSPSALRKKKLQK
jgi:hypothetical protein